MWQRRVRPVWRTALADSPSVDLPTVSANDQDNQLIVVDLVEHPIIAHPDAPDAFWTRASNQRRASRPRIVSESADRDPDSDLDRSRQPF